MHTGLKTFNEKYTLPVKIYLGAFSWMREDGEVLRHFHKSMYKSSIENFYFASMHPVKKLKYAKLPTNFQ